MPSDGARSGGNRPQRGDWRGRSGRSDRSTPAAKTAVGKEGHDWARRRTDDSAKLLWIFRAKIATGVLLAIGLFVAIVLILRKPTTTPFISLVVTEYQFPVPPNAWAYDDVENIRRVLAREGDNRTGGEPLAVTDERSVRWKVNKDEWLGDLRREVEKAATIKWWQTLGRGPDDGAVIIYLSGLGVVDDEGQACLLLPSSSPSDSLFDSSRRMPIRELLDELFYDRANERQRLPREVLKLVILDAGRIDQDWELGLPYNTFVDSLRGIVESDMPVSNLFVLNSADSGQRAWPSPELGGTVFGHFVRRGLQGHADGYAAGSTVRDGDRFVTVEELYEYVRRQTTRFVATYRGDEQRPILLAAAGTDGSARDRKLVEYGPSVRDVEAPDSDEVAAARRERMAAIAGRWSEIYRRGWQRYDELRDRGIRRHPLVWQRFEHMLLRLERLANAGAAKEYQEQYETGLEELSDLIKRVESTEPTVAVPNGIALATALGANPYAGDPKPLDAAAAGLDGGKPIEGAAASNYPFRAQAAWRWILRSSGSADLEARLDRLHKEFLPTTGNWRIEDEPVETHFVRMLAAHRNLREKLDPGLFAAALRRRDEAERVAAPADLRVHYHLRPIVSPADEARRKAEDALFVGRAADVPDIEQSGAAADALYRQAGELAAALAEAYALRDRALAEIPWLVRYRARRLEASAATESEDRALEDLLDLDDATTQWIGEFVKRGAVDSAAVNEFAEQTKRLRGRFEALRAPIIETMRKRSAQGSATDRLRLLDALALPLLTGDDRMTLYDQARDLFGDKFRYTELAPDSTDDSGAVEGKTDRHAERMLKWKTHPALALVAAPQGDYKPGDRASLAAAGKALRTRLKQISERIDAAQKTAGDLSLDDGLTPPTARTEVAAIDLESRAAGLFRGELPKITPAERLEKFDRQRLLVWHFQRTLEDFWGPSPTRLGDPFFDVAAQRLEMLARRQDDGIAGRSPQAPAQIQELHRVRLARRKAVDNGLVPHIDNQHLRIDIDPMAKSRLSEPHAVTIQRAAGADLPAGTAAYYLAEAADTEAAAAAEDARFAAFAGRQVATEDTRLPYEVAAVARGGDPSKLLTYDILDPYEQSQRTKFLRGIVLYRGHRYRHPTERVALVTRGCDRDYEFIPPKYDPPTVTVAGDQKSRAVLLVLDCSISMSDASRMNNARQALKAAVDELLAIGGDTKVGLWLYGHRTRYADEDQPTINTALPPQPSAYARKHGGATVRPAADVEERVPLSNLTPAVKADIGKWVDEVAPHGNTPLYYAIHEALAKGFETLERPQDYERQILVLTDGGNWQFVQDDKVPEADRRRVFVSHLDLQGALESDRKASDAKGVRPVRLDIVGYDFVNEDAKVRRGWNIGNRAELDRLLAPAGADRLGFIYDVNTVAGAELSTHAKLRLLLQALLGVYRFRIYDLATGAATQTSVGDVATGELLRLRQPVRFENQTVRSGRFRVEFEKPRDVLNLGANVQLYGGEPPEDFTFELRDRAENIVLRIHENRGATTLQRWLQQEETYKSRLDYRVRDRENVGDDLKDTAGRQILIYPRSVKWERDAAGVKFNIAIRYPDGKDNFTPQPAEALAVVQPRRNKVDPITIYDVTYEPNASVPELSFVVPKWREKAGDAEQAFVWVYFKFHDKTRSLVKFPAGSTSVQPVTIDGQKIRLAARALFDEAQRKFVVKVTETHEAGSGRRPATMDRIKISMEDAPERIHRCYVTGGDEVVHTFEYPEGRGLTLEKLRDYNVVVTLVEEMKKGAIHVHEAENKAILVNVPR